MNWINIKKRLPDAYDLVLISDGKWISIGEYRPNWNNGNGAFSSEFGCGLSEQPTHWMCLPELPKDDQCK